MEVTDFSECKSYDVFFYGFSTSQVIKGPLLQTWINFNPSMGKSSHIQYSVGSSYLSIPKLEQLHCLGMHR